MTRPISQSTALNSVVRNFYLSLSLLVCAFAIALHSSGALAADPSLHQVYEAAQSGDYKTAQGMMDQVLRDHPNSAKAHFVEAELLAKQGLLAKSETELHAAEKLDPTLGFAQPAALKELKNLLATPAHAALSSGLGTTSPARHSIPWGMILAGVALTAAIVFFLRSRSQANQTYIPAGASGYGPTTYGNAPTYGPTGPAPMGGAPGMGSTILGGLATGAAVGAGMVAGEALMHRVLDGGGHATNSNTAFGNDLGPTGGSLDDAERRYDMGGNDFGVNDTSSWDDSSSSGSDDWS